MPELPEVETIVRHLRARILGETIAAVDVLWPKTVANCTPQALADALVGRRILGVERRAKFLLFDLDGAWLVAHLRMTGRFVLDDEGAPYVRLILRFSSGRALYFSDLRKFGRVSLVADPAALVSGLGAEPLEATFTAEVLGALLAGRRRQLKPALLDQRLVAGLGNIYVDEALWRARLHPLRQAHTLHADEIARLRDAIYDTLANAVAHQGTTLRDFRNPAGEPGANQLFLAAYHRQGQPCQRCGEPIQRLVVGQRGTHICPQCQRLEGDHDGADPRP
jgi:formamidopyrimidine-DNA glycosylase